MSNTRHNSNRRNNRSRGNRGNRGGRGNRGNRGRRPNTSLRFNQQRFSMPVFDEWQTIEEIKQGFEQMYKQDGFDFRYKMWDFEGERFSKFKQRVYLRFECTSEICIKRRFTTSKGTSLFKFKFYPLKRFLNQNPNYRHLETQNIQNISNQHKILKWKFYLFRMQCRECQQMAKPFIYQDNLRMNISKIKKLLKNILLKISRVKKQIKFDSDSDSDQAYQPHLVQHLSKYCQACQLGECNFDEDQERIDDDLDIND